jgi:C1A family cysteine protease
MLADDAKWVRDCVINYRSQMSQRTSYMSCARTQVLQHAVTGHILAVSDEVRRALMANERESYYRAFGWRPSMPDPRDIIADSDAIPILAEVDPRGTYMPPIYDQGHLGSCTANAVAAAIDADRLADGQGAMNPSRLAIYWLERYLEHQPAAADSGAMGRDGFKAARNFGIIPESDWSYTDDASDPRFAEDPRTCTKWNDDHWVLDDKYKAVHRSLIDFKRVLSNRQTIAFGFAVFRSFVSKEVASTGIVPPPDPSQIIPNEGHEVLAIGYLQGHPEHCLCRNSWGTDWGMGGYFLMPWSVMLDPSFSSDFRTIYRPLG